MLEFITFIIRPSFFVATLTTFPRKAIFLQNYLQLRSYKFSQQVCRRMMAPATSRLLRLAPLLFVLFFGIFLFTHGASATEPSPSANGNHADLICHTSDPSECYPRVFQPTEEFQVVHDDQELPGGLHIRLNIYSGQKEAKINVPNEIDPALANLPVDRSVVMVDRPEGQEQVPIPKGAPAYEPVGQVKEPPIEAAGFWDSLAVLKKGIKGSDGELSSDIYYGLKITEDADAVKALLCLMTSGAQSEDRQSAARILGGALQNNPKALAQVEKVWGPFMESQCAKTGSKLQESFYASLMPAQEVPTDELDTTSSRIGSSVFAIKGLLKSRPIRDDFIANGGMKNLLEILVPESEAWAPAQRKVGVLLLDTFLDDEAGATLGVWPRGPAAQDSICKVGATTSDDGCWEYHVRRIKKQNKGNKSHWSVEVYDKLTAARKVADAFREKTEL
jgi:nucleotide exchange factor SIL1